MRSKLETKSSIRTKLKNKSSRDLKKIYKEADIIKKYLLVFTILVLTACSNTKTPKANSNLNGYDKNGYNVMGFNMNGIHKKTKTKYDLEGYNKEGYNKEGFNKNGYDLDGYHPKWVNYFSKDEFIKFDSTKKMALKNGDIILGMEKNEVLASLGAPEKKKMKQNKEVWNYMSKELYFKGERLIMIHSFTPTHENS